MKTTLKASLIALSIAAMPFAANAAGLGRITVQSALGQPLRAEIELLANADELKGLEASIPGLDVFKQSSVPFTSFMSEIKVTLAEKGGKPVLRLNSRNAINEPFVDLLVEINWPAGRLVKEFTFLLDPPLDIRSQGVRVAPVAPVAKPSSPSLVREERITTTPPLPSTEAAKPMEAQPAEPAKGTAASEGSMAKPLAGQDGGAEKTHEIQRGDTLRSIAQANLQPGVSLDQMLVALFKANPDAFQGNMNRLRTGKVITIPDREAAAEMDAKAARREVVAQARDFNEYRARLAGAAPTSGVVEASSRVSGGKVSPRIEEHAAPGGDQSDLVKVSRTQDAGKNTVAAERLRSLEEDIAAREKSLGEANARVAQLETSVKELQSLLEMRNQAMAKLQESVAAKAAAEAAKPLPPMPPAEPVKAVEAPKPTPAPEVIKPVVPPAEPVKPTVSDAKPSEATLPPVKPAESAPAEVKPAEVQSAPKPAQPKPAPKPPKKAPPPPPPEPTLLESIMDNPMLLAAGGGAIVLLLGAVALLLRRKKGNGSGNADLGMEDTNPNLAQGVFSTAGGQVVDTAASSSVIATDFSQAGMTSIDADEGVDPVAEADVYMAYGRDAQAEEILVDALKHDPSRVAIHLKLLDIYAQRGSLKQFETTATELYGLTGGKGEDWEKAAAMGRELDGANPLYGQGAAAVAPVEDAKPVRSFDGTSSVLDLDVPVEEEAAPSNDGGLSFDLPGDVPATGNDALTFDLPSDEAKPAAAHSDGFGMGGAEATILDLDMNFGMGGELEPEPMAAQGEPYDATVVADIRSLTDDIAAPAPALEDQGLSFDFEVPKAPSAAGGAGEFDAANLEFDLNLGDSAAQAPAPAAPLDLSGINLDLPQGGGAAAGASDEESEHVETKLELARAYEEMGDAEGARELLEEVLKEGNGEQQARAKELIGRLG